MRQAVEAMDAIAKSSQQISQIIGVIDEIAFQTNLLALNAGVEAARAGDAGRGFAVVASEVRALAQRSAEAAKEIKGLISASTTQVDHGVKLVAETGKSLERIMAQVTEINDVVGEIAAGAKEQATGLARSQHRDQPDGSGDAAERRDGRGIDGGEPFAVAGDRAAFRPDRPIPGRRPGDDPMRRELQKAAPHAFRDAANKGAAAKAAPARPAAATPHKPQPIRRPAAAKAAAAGGADQNCRSSEIEHEARRSARFAPHRNC